jgi:hypothetical protein
MTALFKMYFAEVQRYVRQCEFFCNFKRRMQKQTYLIHFYYKGKVKLTLCLIKHQAMKTYWGSGGIAPRIL